MCGSPAQPDRARSAAIKVFRTPSLRQFCNHFNAPPLAADEIVHGRRHALVGLWVCANVRNKLHLDQVSMPTMQNQCPVSVPLSISVRNHRANIVPGQSHAGDGLAARTTRRSARPQTCPGLLLARPIARVAQVQRPAIQTDIRAETVQFDEPLRGIVTFLAKRLERSEPEPVDVAGMWLDVIANRAVTMSRSRQYLQSGC
jgi:hypothetical protein